MKQHKISLTSAILNNINIMVGSGILIGPGVMAGISGNASFLSWLIVAALFLPIVLSTVQLSRMCPGAGGFYAYAKEGLNRTAGYWSGWLYITGYTFAVAVEVLALRQISQGALGADWEWFTANPMLFNAVLVAAIVGLNLLSLRVFNRILNSMTISKMIPLVILILLIPFILNPSFTITTGELSLLPYSLPMAIFGYFGFEYTCSISHLVEDSERNAPRAILIGFSVTAIIYALFHFGVLNLMGPEKLNELGAPLYADFLNLPIPYLKAFLKWLIPAASVITLFAGACGLLNANAVMLHAMAEEKLFAFWPTMAQMTSWYRPYVTVIMQGIISFSIATLLPRIEVIGGLCNVGVFLSFILPFVSLIAVQRRTGKHHKVPLSILALFMAILLSLYSIYKLAPTMNERLVYALPFLAFLAIGMIIKREPETAS